MTSPSQPTGPPPNPLSSPSEQQRRRHSFSQFPLPSFSPLEQHRRRHSFSQFLLPGDLGFPSDPSSSSSGSEPGPQTTEPFNGSASASASVDSNLSTTSTLVERPVDLRRVHAATDLTSLLDYPQITNSLNTDLNSATIPSEDDSLEPERQAANQANNQATGTSLFWSDEPSWSFSNIHGLAVNSASDLPNSQATHSHPNSLTTPDRPNSASQVHPNLSSIQDRPSSPTNQGYLSPLSSQVLPNSLPIQERSNSPTAEDLPNSLPTQDPTVSPSPQNSANSSGSRDSSLSSNQDAPSSSETQDHPISETSEHRPSSLPTQERAISPSPRNSSSSSFTQALSGSSRQEAPSSITTQDGGLPWPYSEEIGLADHEDNSPEAWFALQRELAEQGVILTTPYDRDPSNPSLLQLTVERILREDIFATPPATNNTIPIVAVNGRVIEEIEDDNSETASGDHTNLDTTQTNLSPERGSESAAPFIPPGLSALDERLIQIPWTRTPGLQPRPLLDYDFEVTEAQLANEDIVTVDPPRIVNPLFPRPGQVTHTTQAPQPSDIIMTRRLRHPARRAFTATPIPVIHDGGRRSATDSQITAGPRLRRVGRSGSLRSLARSQAETDEAEADTETAASDEAEDDGAPAQEQWQAPEDYMSSDDEDEDEEGRVNLDEVDAPAAEQLRAGLAHLSEVRVEIDVLDGDLPVGAARGNPAAIRARADLAIAEGEIRGAFGQLWESLLEAREVAVDAQAGNRRLQDEARRLATVILESRLDAALARERAVSNAALLERAELEIAFLRERLQDREL